MKRVGLVRVLKGTTIFLALMAAVFYILAFPEVIREMGRMEPKFEWLVTPCIIAVSLSAVPVAVALMLFWRICTEIGRDNSFSHENARHLTGIGICAMVDTGYCAVGTATVFAITGAQPGVMLLSMAAILVGLMIAMAAFLLSHLVLKAADLKAENDLTI